jgi:hypothetical protein
MSHDNPSLYFSKQKEMAIQKNTGWHDSMVHHSQCELILRTNHKFGHSTLKMYSITHRLSESYF